MDCPYLVIAKIRESGLFYIYTIISSAVDCVNQRVHAKYLTHTPHRFTALWEVREIPDSKKEEAVSLNGEAASF